MKFFQKKDVSWNARNALYLLIKLKIMIKVLRLYSVLFSKCWLYVKEISLFITCETYYLRYLEESRRIQKYLRKLICNRTLMILEGYGENFWRMNRLPDDLELVILKIHRVMLSTSDSIEIRQQLLNEIPLCNRN